MHFLMQERMSTLVHMRQVVRKYALNKGCAPIIIGGHTAYLYTCDYQVLASNSSIEYGLNICQILIQQKVSD